MRANERKWRPKDNMRREMTWVGPPEPSASAHELTHAKSRAEEDDEDELPLMESPNIPLLMRTR